MSKGRPLFWKCAANRTHTKRKQEGDTWPMKSASGTAIVPAHSCAELLPKPCSTDKLQRL